MAKFDVWIPNIEVDAENHEEALKKAAELLKTWIEEDFVQKFGEAELMEEEE